MRVAIAAILLALSGCVDRPQPVNPAFDVSFSQAEAAMHDMREHPRPLARPLVIIGGFCDPNVSPPLFASEFESLTGDQHIVTVSVGLCGSFAECRQRVIDAVEKAYPSTDTNWTTEVDVVGASLGGLVARYAATPSDDPKHPKRLRIARLFSISSPHTGARLADAVALTQFHRDMRTGSEFLKHLASFDAAAQYKLFPYVLLDDGIVGLEHAAPPGQAPLWLANRPLDFATHLAAMIDPRIAADIARRLRGEQAWSNPALAKPPPDQAPNAPRALTPPPPASSAA